MKPDKIRNLLLAVSIACAVLICLFRLTVVGSYITASRGEIMQWYPRFGAMWLSIRNDVIPVLAWALVISLVFYVALSSKLLRSLWIAIKIVVYSAVIYLVLWLGWPVIIGLAIITYLALKFIYPLKLEQFKSVSAGFLKRNQDMALGVFTACLMLFLAEFFLRYAGINDSYFERNGSGHYNSPYNSADEKGWYHLRNPKINDGVYKTTEYTFHYQTNSQGLSDKEWPLQKRKKRIMCLGDSFTEGLGSTVDSTFEHLLEWTNDSLEVMNCGVAGSDPVFEYKLLEDRLLKYNPDVVIVLINQSDITDLMARGGFERFNADGTTHFKPAPWWEYIYAHSYITRLIVRNGFQLNALYLSHKDDLTATQQAIGELDACLDKFETLCNQKGMRCLFVFQPGAYDFKTGTTHCDPVIKYAEGKHYEVIDLFDYFQQHGVNASNAGNYYWPVDGHNNNKGYALFADAIKAKL